MLYSNCSHLLCFKFYLAPPPLCLCSGFIFVSRQLLVSQWNSLGFSSLVENHISVKSEYDCGSSVSRISAIYWSFVFRLTIILRPFLGRISFLFGCWLCNGWRSSVGFLSVIFRLYDGSQSFDGRFFCVLSVIARLLGVCRLSVTCWSFVGRLTIVGPLPVACLLGVVRLSVDCRSVDCSRPFVNSSSTCR